MNLLKLEQPYSPRERPTRIKDEDLSYSLRKQHSLDYQEKESQNEIQNQSISITNPIHPILP